MQYLLFPFLGIFGCIPIEIRLMIWDHLFSSLRKQPLKDDLHKDKPRSILCTSRYLYNEISSHIFRNSEQHIFISPIYNEENWMVMQLKSRVVDVEWAFSSKADAKRHFQNFPHPKTKMIVHISCPNPSDPGQMVLLWQKLNLLVDLLIPVARPTIELATNGPWCAEDPPTHWGIYRDQFYEMGALQESIQSGPKFRPDHDLAMLPFLRLGLWVQDPETNVPAMSDRHFKDLFQSLVSLFDQKGIELRLKRLLAITQDTAVSQIGNALTDTDMFLETCLDELPGRTASFLRLERYKNWFEDGTSWESPYETRMRDQLSTCPWVIMNTDPWLHRSNQRYIVLILLHHFMYAMRANLCDGLRIFDDARIYTTWDSELWSYYFPDGVSELSHIQTWLTRFWPQKSQFRKFHAYTDWIGQRRAEENGADESSCEFIHRLSLWGH